MGLVGRYERGFKWKQGKKCSRGPATPSLGCSEKKRTLLSLVYLVAGSACGLLDLILSSIRGFAVLGAGCHTTLGCQSVSTRPEFQPEDHRHLDRRRAGYPHNRVALLLPSPARTQTGRCAAEHWVLSRPVLDHWRELLDSNS